MPGLTACVLHSGYIDPQGYGRNGPGTVAHLAAWRVMRGPVPPGMELHHVCENKACVNVAHLVPVTRKQHEALHAPTHCVNGHPFDAENTYARPGGWRQCRACNRAAVARYTKRKAA
jgi:hypothetical protein